MTRHALTLAALLDAAVPGTRPARVEEVIERVGERFRVGFIEDSAGERWVVRLPADAVAAALQDQSAALLRLLAGRVPFEVPRPAGFASVRDGRRAMAYPLIPGRTLSFAALPPGTGLAQDLGAAIAAVHNLDPRIFDEAGLPAYDAADCRRRRQSEIDLGAQTGLVPAGLLQRWEAMLDNVAWWRFPARPVHGRLDAEHVLVTLPGHDEDDDGAVTALVSWENAQIGDPAEDLAAVLAQAAPETAGTVLGAYARARSDAPDPALPHRATLLYELRLLTALLTARRLDDLQALRLAASALSRLAEQVGREDLSGTGPDGSWHSAPANAGSAGVPAGPGDSRG